MLRDAHTLDFTSYRWFGAPNGAAMPDLGDKATHHTRGDRAERPALRKVPIARFVSLDGVEQLVDLLFGAVELV